MLLQVLCDYCMNCVYENLFHEVYLHIKVNTDEGFGDETTALFIKINLVYYV